MPGQPAQARTRTPKGRSFADAVLAERLSPAYTAIVTAAVIEPVAPTAMASRPGPATIDVVTVEPVAGNELPEPGTWTIDPAHSSGAAHACRLGVASVREWLAELAGRVGIATPFEASTASATIDAASEPHREYRGITDGHMLAARHSAIGATSRVEIDVAPVQGDRLPS